MPETSSDFHEKLAGLISDHLDQAEQHDNLFNAQAEVITSMTTQMGMLVSSMAGDDSAKITKMIENLTHDVWKQSTHPRGRQ